MVYTIGEAARQMGVAPSTLRYYEKEGLLPFLGRSDGGIRTFRESDIAWLNIIDCLKSAGLPIRDIRQYIDWAMEGDSTIGRRLELFRQQRQVVLDQIAHLEDTLRTLDYKCWYYETALAAGTCDVLDRLPLEQVPPQFRERRAALSSQAG